MKMMIKSEIYHSRMTLFLKTLKDIIKYCGRWGAHFALSHS